MTKLFVRMVTAFAIAILLPVWANAAELVVYSTIGVQAALERIGPNFEKVSGHKVSFKWGTAAMLVKQVQAGATPDFLVLTRDGVEALAKEGKILPGTSTALANSGVAVAVKSGAPLPDISTPDSFKRALLTAKSIAYSDPAAGGASGVYISKLLEKLGIAEAMNEKTKFPPAGGNSANLLVSGEAELAIQQKPEVMAVSGVTVVGVLPTEINNVTAFVSGIATSAKNMDAAQAFAKFLKSSEATAILAASGLDPA